MSLTQTVNEVVTKVKHRCEVWLVDSSINLFRTTYYIDGQTQNEPLVDNPENTLAFLQQLKKDEPSVEIVHLVFGNYYPPKLEALLKKIWAYDPKNPKPEDFVLKSG